MASFGAFVEISSQIEGLVHISEIQEDHVNRVEDVLKVGQKVQARVVNIDTQERRIGLSIKAAQLEDLQADVQASQSKMSGGGSLNSLADIFDQLTKNT
jgi:small subunit ribosomal protein S1